MNRPDGTADRAASPAPALRPGHHGRARAYAQLRGESMGTTWAVQYAIPHEAPPENGSAGATPSARESSLDDAPGAGAPDSDEALGGRPAETHSLPLHQAIQAALDCVVDQMSTWEPDSVISTLNRAEPGWYQIPAEFFHVLGRALQIAEQSGGAYDPTMGRLTDLWGFGPKGPVQEPPAHAEIAAALSTAGWRRTALNEPLRGVWQPGGMQFDLSSIAKGYGADEIARVLDEHGAEHYLVELGGELKAKGRNPQGTQWALDIETPGHASSGFPLTLTDCAIATSGDYRRCFHHHGQRYAHTLDPRTGRPLQQALESVSVLHAQCMVADGLATALLCLGLEEGLAHARRHKIPALFMSRSGQELALDWTDEFQVLGGR